jgi:hypothetical protein
VRDPRWGRAQEVYSEDPKLTGDLSAKFVQGAQGSSEDGSAEEKELLTVACCKHLAAYDLENFQVGTPPNNGVVDRVRFDANITSRNMWEFYLPAFETCLRDGQAASVMCSFNSVSNTCLPTSYSCPLQQLKEDLCVPDRISHHCAAFLLRSTACRAGDHVPAAHTAADIPACLQPTTIICMSICMSMSMSMHLNLYRYRFR